MSHTTFIKIGLICVLGLAACGEEKMDDPSTQPTQTTIGEPSAKVAYLNFIGTFISDSRRPGDLTQLVLKTNGTFHSATLVECFAPPCNPVQEDGNYRISWRDARRYITLYGIDETIIDRYQYESRDNSLRLLKVTPEIEAVPGADWLPMWLSTAAWCGSYTPTGGSAPSDCDLQNLPIGPCAGQWSCVSNMCNWNCAAPM